MEKIKNLLRETNLDAVLLLDEINGFYFTKFQAEDSVVLAFFDRVILFLDKRYLYEGQNAPLPPFVEVREGGALEAYLTLQETGAKRVGLDYGKTTLKDLEKVDSGEFTFLDVSKELISLRSVKSQDEIDIIKENCLLCDEAFTQFKNRIQVGMTELDAVYELEYLFKRSKGQRAFQTIVAFGENSAVPHHKPNDAKLNSRDIILVDFGIYKNGYASDMTRTFFIGDATKKQREVYEIVKGAHLLVMEKANVFLSCKDVDKLARDEITRLGYGEYFTHSLGHGVGLEIHEAPYFSKVSNHSLKKGQIITVEPGVYLSGEFGVRLENTVLCDGERLIPLS